MKRKEWTVEERQALGLEGMRLGESVVMRWSQEAEQGQVMGGEMTRERFEGYDFTPLPSVETNELLESLGLRLQTGDEQGRILRVDSLPFEAEGEEREPLVIRLLPGKEREEKGWWQHPDDPGTVVVYDLRRLGAATVGRWGGPGLLFKEGEEGIEATPYLPEPVQSEEYAVIEGEEIVQWLEDLEDTWLCGEIEQHLEAETAWDTAVAVGLYARLQQQEGEEARAIVQQLLQGEADAAFHRPWRWSRHLSSAQLKTLRRHLTEEIQILLEGIDYLEETLQPEEETWRQSLRELLYRRDDIECVSCLLEERGALESVQGLLELLDQKGSLFLASLPVVPLLQEERLLRSSQLHPLSWWVDVVRED